MSVVIETFIVCDGRGTEDCLGQYGVDNRHLTGKQHREQFKADGWAHRDGKDYCPKCKTLLFNFKVKP